MSRIVDILTDLFPHQAASFAINRLAEMMCLEIESEEN